MLALSSPDTTGKAKRAQPCDRWLKQTVSYPAGPIQERQKLAVVFDAGRRLSNETTRSPPSSRARRAGEGALVR